MPVSDSISSDSEYDRELEQSRIEEEFISDDDLSFLEEQVDIKEVDDGLEIQ